MAGRVAALEVNVWGLDVEAHIPTGAVTADGGEQHLGTRRHHRLPGTEVGLCGGAEQPSQPAGIVVHPDHTDGWQRHRAGMTLTDSNTTTTSSTVARLVAEPETVPAAPFALAPWEAGPAALAHTGFGVAVSGECPTKVNRSLLEHLRGDRMPPPQARNLLDDGAVRSDDKQPASLFGLLPSVKRLDQVEFRPRHPNSRVYPLGGKGIGDQPKALVVGEPRRPSVPGEHRRLRGGRGKGEPEGGVTHGSRDRTGRM
jgi:hypothetical protein